MVSVSMHVIRKILTLIVLVGFAFFNIKLLHFINASENPKHDDHVASRHSAFVPMASIPEKEHRVFPGMFRYGGSKLNEEGNVTDAVLILTGASMAGDYHNQDMLWLHLFGMGESMFQLGQLGECYSRDERKNEQVRFPGGGNIRGLKTFTEMKGEIFHCRIGTRTARFELMPTDGVDANTIEVVQVWRCPLHGVPGREPVLSDLDFQLLRRRSLDHNMALTIDVLHEGKEGENNQAGLTPVVKLHLPIAEPSLGIQRMLSHLPSEPSFISERHNITLCTVSHANGIRDLNEFIRYHHDVVGIDHIHLGLFTNFGEGGKEQAMQVHRIVSNLLLKPDIFSGTLSVSALWDEDFDFQCSDQEFPKMVFYQQCLYRAKGTSEFVATWDLDEFFSFKGAEDEIPRNGPKTLPNFLRGIEHPECQDWSFVTMMSVFAGGSVSDGESIGSILLDRPRQSNETDDVWQKSILRTKNVFYNTYHLPGACLPQGKTNISDVESMNPIDGECAFYTHDARMIHARNDIIGDGHLVANEVLTAILAIGELGNR